MSINKVTVVSGSLTSRDVLLFTALTAKLYC